MTPERRREIRRLAALRCAAELNSTVIEDGDDSKTVEDWPDEAEREVFGRELTAIIRRLYRRGGLAP